VKNRLIYNIKKTLKKYQILNETPFFQKSNKEKNAKKFIIKNIKIVSFIILISYFSSIFMHFIDFICHFIDKVVMFEM